MSRRSGMTFGPIKSKLERQGKRPPVPPHFDVNVEISKTAARTEMPDFKEKLELSNIDLFNTSPLDPAVDLEMSAMGITHVNHKMEFRFMLFKIQCDWKMYEIKLKHYNSEPYDAEACDIDLHCFLTSIAGVASRIMDLVFKK